MHACIQSIATITIMFTHNVSALTIYLNMRTGELSVSKNVKK